MSKANLRAEETGITESLRQCGSRGEPIAGFEAGAAGKFAGGHAIAAFGLHEFEMKTGRGAANDENIFFFGEDGARLAALAALGQFDGAAPNVAKALAKMGERAGPGIEGANLVEDARRRFGPVNQAFFSFERRSESGARIVLRRGLNRSLGQAAQSGEHQRRAGFGHALGKLRGGFVRADFHFDLFEDGAGVDAGVDAHGGEAGFFVAVQNGALNGCGAAILRQERSVEIDPAKARNFEKIPRNNLAVGDDDDGVGREAPEKIARGIGANPFGLKDLNPRGQSRFFDRRSSCLAAAAAGAVGLSDYRFDGKIRLGEQALERGNAERGSSAKYDAQSHRAPTIRRLWSICGFCA